MSETVGLLVETLAGPGVLHQLTGVMAAHRADITSVEIVEQSAAGALVSFELALPPASVDPLRADLEALSVVRAVTMVPTLGTIYGKRLIIVGGG
ncbi:MAG TPA: hypothetical protein VK454_10925, partial [Myxococcaceae bacterium]|nr:hypothetical protein [Myxococcaceae bacterium]